MLLLSIGNITIRLIDVKLLPLRAAKDYMLNFEKHYLVKINVLDILDIIWIIKNVIVLYLLVAFMLLLV